MARYLFNDPDAPGRADAAPAEATPAAARRSRWVLWSAFSLLNLALTAWLALLWLGGRLAWWEAAGLALLGDSAALAYALDAALNPPTGARAE
jgi:hypothetical protein